VTITEILIANKQSIVFAYPFALES